MIYIKEKVKKNCFHKIVTFFLKRFKKINTLKNEKCWYCENYYGPCFDEPICLTCHYFIFPNIIERDIETPSNSGNLQNNGTSSATNGIAVNTNESQLISDHSDDNELNLNVENRSNINNFRTFDEVFIYLVVFELSFVFNHKYITNITNRNWSQMIQVMKTLTILSINSRPL